MPFFRKKNETIVNSRNLNFRSRENLSNYQLRPVATPPITCMRIRNTIGSVFAFETIGFRLMRVAPPLDSDRAGVMRDTGMPLTVRYLESLPAWPSWIALVRQGDPRFDQVERERWVDYDEMVTHFRTLVGDRVSGHNPELEYVQQTSEFTCGTLINIYDHEDFGLSFYLSGEMQRFRKAASRLRDSEAPLEWGKSHLCAALLNLKRSRPDQFAMLAVNSADYISIGGIEFWQEIMEPTTCPSCSNPVDDPSDRYCAHCGHPLN